jgi:hypothetical protein
MYDHIACLLDWSPNLCCDRKQLIEMQRFKYILDNVIGRCPSCYYNLLHIFCEMACSSEQDQFMWPLELINITRTNDKNEQTDEIIRDDWIEKDYIDPDEVNETETLLESVQVISKVRYFLSEKQAKDFLDSCW